MPDANPAPTVTAALQVARDRVASFAPLEQMSGAERIAAYWRGEFTLGQCLTWARRHPAEVPRVAGGEWHFIAITDPAYLGED